MEQRRSAKKAWSVHTIENDMTQSLARTICWIILAYGCAQLERVEISRCCSCALLAGASISRVATLQNNAGAHLHRQL